MPGGYDSGVWRNVGFSDPHAFGSGLPNACRGKNGMKTQRFVYDSIEVGEVSELVMLVDRCHDLELFAQKRLDARVYCKVVKDEGEGRRGGVTGC
jgi:hypothetical protein